MKRNLLIMIVLLAVPLFIGGCVDKKQLDRIEQNQADILAKVKVLEEKIAKMPAAAAPRRPTIDYNKVHNLPIGSSAVKGNMSAKVTITEFSDFQCPYCSKLQPTLNEVLKAYPNDVKLVFKDFATKLNLDMNKFTADFSSNKYDKLIQDDINLGRAAGVTGTPSLFMNGKRMQRRSFEDFKQLIEGYLKK